MKFKHRGLVSIAVAVMSLTLLFLWKSEKSVATTNNEEYNQGVRNVIAEIGLPNSNNAQAIQTATNNFAQFIYYRSGIVLSENNKNLLNQSELASRQQSVGISQEQLSDILSGIAISKLNSLSSNDFSNMAETLSGFDAPDVSPSLRQNRAVILRFSNSPVMSKEQFMAHIEDIKGSQTKGFFRDMVKNAISAEVEKKVSKLSRIDPENFSDSKEKMDALQAMIVTYAVVTDDPLASNEARLQDTMSRFYKSFQRSTGMSRGNPQGRKAFGKNGYLFSSPTDYFFDNATVETILASYSQRSNIQ